MCGLVRANDVRGGSEDARYGLAEPGAEVEVRGDRSASRTRLRLAGGREVFVQPELSGAGVVGAGAEDDQKDVPESGRGAELAA